MASTGAISTSWSPTLPAIRFPMERWSIRPAIRTRQAQRILVRGALIQGRRLTFSAFPRMRKPASQHSASYETAEVSESAEAPRLRLASSGASAGDDAQPISAFLDFDALGGDPQGHRLLGGPGASRLLIVSGRPAERDRSRLSLPRGCHLVHRSIPSALEPSRSFRRPGSAYQGRNLIFAGGRCP